MLSITRGVNLHAFTSHNSPKQSLRQHPVDFCWKSCSWNLVSHFFQDLSLAILPSETWFRAREYAVKNKNIDSMGALFGVHFFDSAPMAIGAVKPLVSPFYSWKIDTCLEIHSRLTTLTTFLGGKAPSNLLSQNGRYLLIKESPVWMWDGSMKWFFLVQVVGILYEFS